MKSLPFTGTKVYKTYLTSPEFAQAAKLTLGEIDVDPCAAPDTQFIEAKVLWRGLTSRTDGMTKPWKGNVYFNCDNYERPLRDPMTKELIECPHEFHKMSKWVDKLRFELDNHIAKQAIGFFPNRLFKDWAQHTVLRKASAICFHTRNIVFYTSVLDNGVYTTHKATYSNVGDGYLTALFSDSPETINRFAIAYTGLGTLLRTSLLEPV
jgi:hypothetical protein